ncbi:MAG: ABC transporter ATP-binding protein/permease [Francisella sp.]
MISFFRNYWLISQDFWKSKSGIIAILILSFCTLLELINVSLNVYLNHWYVSFYNAIAQYDKQTVLTQLLIFAGITLAMLFTTFLLYICGQYLVIWMRKPITDNYVSNWLTSKSYNCYKNIYDNPEERISYDIQQFIILSKDLFLTVIHSVATLISFSIILWELSGILSIHFYNYQLNIYGYLFWTAMLLGIINVWAVFRVGRPLKDLLYSQQKYEADFRYGLAVVRNNKNLIYDNLSEKREYILSKKIFSRIIENFYKITFRKAKIDIVRSFFIQIYSLTGIILALPRYFHKSINFGQIMQVQSAFYNVISPMLFLVFWYENLTQLRTNVTRLYELKKSINNSSKKHKNIRIVNDKQKYLLSLKNIYITKSDGYLLQNINFSLAKGESIFIYGSIGKGKTSLLKTITGHSNNFEGQIIFNKIPKILFLSHIPYFPEDDFKKATFYPLFTNLPTDKGFKNILDFLDIGYLYKFINTTHNWRDILSYGEQQKLRLCKIFIKNYDLILFDNITSSLDEKSEQKIYKLLKDKQISYISASHNDRIRKYHNKIILL